MRFQITSAKLRRRSGFTLIELLTVVAIIGILAAIITASVGAARAAAHRSACVSNLRSVGIALLTAASERKGRVPGPILWSSPNTYTTNSAGAYDLNTYPSAGNQLGPYMEMPKPAPNTVQYFTPLLCPAWHAATGNKPVGDTSFTNVTWRPSKFFVVSGADITGEPDRPVLLSEIEKPSKEIALYEMDSVNGGGSKAPQPYHRGKRTRVFFDGHVEHR